MPLVEGVILDTENAESWKQVYDFAKSVYPHLKDDEWRFIVDGQKGILPSIPALLAAQRTPWSVAHLAAVDCCDCSLKTV